MSESLPSADKDAAQTCEPKCHAYGLGCACRSAERDAGPGAWLVYDYDHGPYAISLHATAEEAARCAARQGYGKIGFWPFGSDMADAVKAWEAPSPRVLPPATPGADQ